MIAFVSNKEQEKFPPWQGEGMEKKTSISNIYFAYICSLLLFGTNGVLASHIDLQSMQIVLLRTGIGSLCLVALFLAEGGRFQMRKYRKSYGFLTLSGSMMGCSWMLLYEAYRFVGVSIASLCMYSSLALVMAASVLLFKETLTRHKLMAFLVACLGTVLVNLSALTEHLSAHGIMLGMCACATYAAMIVSAKLASGIPDLEKSAWQLLAAFLTTAVFTLLKGELVFQINVHELGWILALGLLNTGVGCYFYFSSIGGLPAQNVAICDNIELLSAILSSSIFLGEHLTKPQIIGAVLIVSGAILSVQRKRASQRFIQTRRQGKIVLAKVAEKS